MKDSMLTGDQEIRVIALDFATKLIDYQTPTKPQELVSDASEIESYIREGTNGR